MSIRDSDSKISQDAMSLYFDPVPHLALLALLEPAAKEKGLF